MDQNRQVWLLAALGIIYSVLATRLWMMSWSPLVPLMGHIFFFRLLFGPFWFAVELAPITIALTLLRVNLGWAMLAIFAYEVIMNAAEVVFPPAGYGVRVATVLNFPLNYVLQVPVWALTWLAVRAVRSVKA
jgi:hypothetical protein